MSAAASRLTRIPCMLAPPSAEGKRYPPPGPALFTLVLPGPHVLRDRVASGPQF